MSENIWVSKDDAVETIRKSDWAKLKEPYIVERRSLLDLTAMANQNLFKTRTVSGVSDNDKVNLKFSMFLEATLRSFQRNNPAAYKVTDTDLEEFELAKLKHFLAVALEVELAEDFGPVPDFKVV